MISRAATSFSRAFTRAVSVLVPCALVLATVLFEWLRNAHAVLLYGVSPEELYQGTARLPFQHRALVPLIVRLWARAVGRVGGDHGQMFEEIDFLAVALIWLVNLALLRRFNAGPGWLAVLYVMMLANYVFAPRPYFTPYDMPAILLFSLGLFLIREQRWVGYAALLPVALLNRETAAGLVLVFALVEWRRMPFPRYAAGLAAQLAICAAVRLALFRLYPAESRFLDSFWGEFTDTGRYLIVTLNLRVIFSRAFPPVFGFMWLPFLVAWWYLGDKFLRRLAWFVPIAMAALLFVGNFFEFRIFGEMLPVLTLVIASAFGPMLTGRFSRPD